MSDNEPGPRSSHDRGWLDDFRFSLALLTWLPMPAGQHPRPERLAQACRAFPLIGALIGVASAIVYSLAFGLGLPSLPAAMLAIAALILITGAVPEDALARLVDGLASGSNRPQKLSVMHERGLGSHGVLALVLCLSARIAALDSLADTSAVLIALVTAGAMSRTAIAWLLFTLPPTRSAEDSIKVGHADIIDVAIASGIALLIALLLLSGRNTLYALTGALVGTVVIGVLVHRQIGGQNPMALGAAQQFAETGCLLGLIAASAV